MTALTSDRQVLEKGLGLRFLPVAAGAVLHSGSIAVLNANGYVQAATTATGLVAVGRSNWAVNNSQGANGAVNVQVQAGPTAYAYNNATGADAITQAAIGSTAYLVDDQTVALTNGNNTRSPAGRVFDVDANGVWILFS